MAPSSDGRPFRKDQQHHARAEEVDEATNLGGRLGCTSLPRLVEGGMPKLCPAAEPPEHVGVRSVQHITNDARLGKPGLERSLP